MIGRLIVVFFAISAVFAIFWVEKNIWRVDKEPKLVKIQNVEYGFEAQMWKNIKQKNYFSENENGRMDYMLLHSDYNDFFFAVVEATYIPKKSEIDYELHVRDNVDIAIQNMTEPHKLKKRPLDFYRDIPRHTDSFEDINTKNYFVIQSIYITVPEKRKVYELYAGFYESPENREKAYQFFKSFKLK